ncbi:L-cysteine desulfidase family protein [Porphyromonas sp.]
MLTPTQIRQITALVHREVVPATGCTEPAAVALTVAYAAAQTTAGPRSIEVLLSGNMLKNAMGVGIPGTGTFGIPIAIALGAILAAPDKQLELLDSFTDDELHRAQKMIESGCIHIGLKEGDDIDRLYVEVLLTDTEGRVSTAVIQATHTGLTSLTYDGEDRFVATDRTPCTKCPEQKTEEETIALNFDLVYEYALHAPLDELNFIYEAAQLNKRASEFSFTHSYGHNLGKLINSDLGRRYLGDSPLTQMLAYTSSACDARMDGAPVTVMSNSGSGNQGISSMLPVLTFAEEQGADREKTTRAIMLSSLLVIYVKQLLGRLSCLCGMVVSGIGSACAITYLMGGTKEQSIGAVKNMIGNVSGMICDGAKPSCSLKASTGVSSALISALLSMQGHVVTATEGIVDEDIDICIANLADLGRDGMAQADLKVLKIMTSKGQHHHA